MDQHSPPPTTGLCLCVAEARPSMAQRVDGPQWCSFPAWLKVLTAHNGAPCSSKYSRDIDPGVQVAPLDQDQQGGIVIFHQPLLLVSEFLVLGFKGCHLPHSGRPRGCLFGPGERGQKRICPHQQLHNVVRCASSKEPTNFEATHSVGYGNCRFKTRVVVLNKAGFVLWF